MKRTINLFILISMSFIYIATASNLFSQPQKSSLLNYKFFVRDDNYLPLNNTLLKLKIYDRIKSMSIDAKLVKDTLMRTDEKGIIAGFVFLRESKTRNIYECEITYGIEKEGFCKLNGYEGMFRNINELQDTISINIILSKPESLIHRLSITILDSKGKPVEGAEIKLTANLSPTNNVESNLITDLAGNIKQKLDYGDIKDLCNREFRKNLKTYVYLTINSTGFYKKSDMILIDSEKEKIQLIALNQPSDYFEDNFLLMSKFKKLKENTFDFLNSILLESYLRDCNLDYNSITVENFKKKNYLRLSLSDLNTYNSIKLNNYDIAKRVFDEVIRKLLNPLNDNLQSSKEIDGYCVVVKSKSKNLIDEKSIAKDLTYKFYLLKTEAASYKNKDITGQQLVDKSIILLNDERIDLKFQ